MNRMNQCETKTWVFSVDSLNSSVQQRSASLLNPEGHCYSGSALLDESLMTAERKTNFHSADQIDDIQQGCSEEQQCSEEEMGS